MSRRFGPAAFSAALLAAACLAGCSGGGSDEGQPAETGAGGEATAPRPADVAFASLTGDAARGEAAFIQCRVCHSLEEGRNQIGPSLHAIVGRPAGMVPGYAYSPANKNSKATWTEEELYLFLKDPRRHMPGTKMAFAGIADPQRRADLIAYIKTASQ